MKPMLHTWLDRYAIVDPSHADHLNTLAALHEFTTGKSKDKAEEAAHAEYKKDQLHEAAAHHLVGMKAALGAGDKDSAKKHGAMYGLVLKELGHPIVGEPPSEVSTKAKNLDHKVYNFKAHKADAFALPVQKETTSES